MNIPEIFLHELMEKWWMACAVAAGLLIVGLVRFALSRCLTFFNDTKSFPELAAFSKDDQQMLLREASRGTFGDLSFVPPLVFVAFWWGGLAVALTFQKVTATSHWVGFLAGLFVVLGFRLARRLEAHRVRPFLKKLIDGQNSKTVA